MKIRGRLTTVPDDLPVANGTTGTVIRVKDSAPLGAVSTNDGWYEWIVNGNPGPVRVNFVYDGKTKNQWSEITGPSNGVDVGSLWMAFNAFTSGRISGFSGELAPSATGTTMSVTVAPGAALVKGQLYDQYAPVAVTIPASNPTNPRIDVVVIRCYLNDTGNADEGKTELAVVTGAPAVSPVVPTLTNTSTIYELAIANVNVPAGATVITNGNVTPQPIYATPFLAPGTITSGLLADNSVSTAKVQDGAITTAKLADNSVTSAKIVDGTIATADIADNAITSAKILDGTIVEADIADGAITSAKILDGTIATVDIANKAVTKAKLADDVVLTGNPTLLPGTEFVATGPLASGSRTLNTFAVGPLLAGVQYDIQAEHGVSLRNNVNTGTTVVKVRINGGTFRTHEFQSVGGVPRWAPVKQSATILGTGAFINIDSVVDYASGDPTDIRAGQVTVIAIPR